jgi:hypothetical protein
MRQDREFESGELTMLSIACLGLLVGLLAGNRFKVLVLLQAIGIAWALIGIGEALLARGIWTIAADLLAVSIAIQVGYFCALGAQYVQLATIQRRQPRATALSSTAPLRS